jgi:nickel/cobalt transporter (NiCoT) family protein
METAHLTNDWLVLMFLAFSLGMKHGLDADHLATIDGLARFNARRNRKVARWCGVLFSAGHGAVIVGVSLLVGILAAHWEVPHWAEDLGAWISIGILVLLGLVNLRAVLMTPTHEVVHTVGVKGRFLGRLQQTANPLLIFCIGALFALSFETLTQVNLYALAAAQFGGWRHALALSVAFMLGMMATDGINGLWISHLMRRTDQIAPLASRVMGLTVAALSLIVAAFSGAQYLSSSIAAWSEGKALYFGWGVVALIAVSFAAGLAVTRSRRCIRGVRAAERSSTSAGDGHARS